MGYKPKFGPREEPQWAAVPAQEPVPKPFRKGTKAGRTKLTPWVQDRIIQALKSGAYRQTAAAYAGIGVNCLTDWLAKGRMGRQPYKDFQEAVEKAEADFIIASVSTIRLQSKTQWQAAAWLLERKYPDLYGQRQRMPVASDDDAKGASFVIFAPGHATAEDWAANPTGVALPSPQPSRDRRSGAVDVDEDEADLEVPEEAPGPEADEPDEPEHVDPADVEPDYSGEDDR